MATDVGQHQMWAIQHLHFDYPGQLLTSGGFGTMGFGLGAAIGAKTGEPGQNGDPLSRRRLLPHERPTSCYRAPITDCRSSP